MTDMMQVRVSLFLRQVEDLLHERRDHISHETVHGWWNGFGPMFLNGIYKKRLAPIRGST